MKRIIAFVLCLFLVVGCNSNEKRVESNSNNDESWNSNTNNTFSNSNSNNIEEDEEDEDVGKYTVHLYLFHSSTCEHCKEEIAWLNSIDGQYPYLQIHTYEASQNKELYEKVKSAMKIESEYVPLTIIVEDYFVGFASSKEKKFIRTIKEYSKKDYCDVVGTVINGGDVKACIEKNKGV